MKTIEKILKEEMSYLEQILIKARKRLETAPNGNLRIKVRKGIVEYYYKEKNGRTNKSDEENYKSDKNCNGRYLKKGERHLAKEIAQRDYDLQIVNNVEERIKSISIFLSKYEKTDLKRLYERTNPHRRELIYVPEISDEEFVRRWSAVEYVGKSFAEDSYEIMTEKGERVRSKSEKIIADKLYALGIPYRYEYPLIMEGNIKIYPDFTILKMPSREEVYLEHFGMMDDSKYVETVMCKLSSYEKTGYC